jgi:hypothetical protein
VGLTAISAPYASQPHAVQPVPFGKQRIEPVPAPAHVHARVAFASQGPTGPPASTLAPPDPVPLAPLVPPAPPVPTGSPPVVALLSVEPPAPLVDPAPPLVDPAPPLVEDPPVVAARPEVPVEADPVGLALWPHDVAIAATTQHASALVFWIIGCNDSSFRLANEERARQGSHADSDTSATQAQTGDCWPNSSGSFSDGSRTLRAQLAWPFAA